MRSGRRLVQVIELTKTADPAYGGHAPGMADKTAIDGLIAHAQHCAPRRVLRFSAHSDAGDADANSQREQQEVSWPPPNEPLPINAQRRALGHSPAIALKKARPFYRCFCEALIGTQQHKHD